MIFLKNMGVFFRNKMENVLCLIPISLALLAFWAVSIRQPSLIIKIQFFCVINIYSRIFRDKLITNSLAKSLDILENQPELVESKFGDQITVIKLSGLVSLTMFLLILCAIISKLF